MPDHSIVWPADYIASFFRSWLQDGKFAPDDLRMFFGSPYLWQELKYALALYLSGLALAWFLRGRGQSPAAACGAGLLLAFSGYWSTLFSAGHFGWFQWMTYGVFAFGLVDRAIERGAARYWILLGAVLAWGSLHQPDLWLLFTVFTAIYFLYRTLIYRFVDSSVRRFVDSSILTGTVSGKVFWTRWFLGGLLALASLVAIGAAGFRSAFVNDLAGRDAQIAKGETLGANAKESADARWIFVTNWSLPPAEVEEFFSARHLGDTSCPLTLSLARKAGKGTLPYTGALGRPLGAAQGNYRQHSLYVGPITLVFAFLALVSFILSITLGTKHSALGTKHSALSTKHSALSTDIAFFTIAAIVFLLFSFGRYAEPVYRLVYALPFGDYLRAPVKWHHLTEFSLAVLAGYGLDAAAKFAESKLKPAALKFVPLAVFAVAFLGAADLARVDALYCAPVDVSRARATGKEMQLTIVPDQALRSREATEMIRRGDLVVEGRYALQRGASIVGILKSREKPAPASFGPVTLILGIVSLIGTFSVIGFTILQFVLEKRRKGAVC